MTPDVVRIGTRGSRLALAQASIVADALVAAGACREARLVVVRTEGDVMSARRPTGGPVAGDGQFTAALERAVVAGRADLAVHSFKDLPTGGHPALVVAAVPGRADPRDCLISRHPGGLAGLPAGAIVGTGSARREAQLLSARPDLRPAPIRGNVDTRLARVTAGEYDAVILAAAGMARLGIEVRDDDLLPAATMLPAPAQGALAVHAPADREDLRSAAGLLDHVPSRLAAEAERLLLQAVGGGCLAPLGALVEIAGARARLRAAHAAPGGALAHVDIEGETTDLPAMVRRAAEQLFHALGVAS